MQAACLDEARSYHDHRITDDGDVADLPGFSMGIVLLI